MEVESTTNNEERVAKVLSAHLAKLGWQCELRAVPQNPKRPNVVAIPIPFKGFQTNAASTWKATILMNSHIDTVPRMFLSDLVKTN